MTRLLQFQEATKAKKMTQVQVKVNHRRATVRATGQIAMMIVHQVTNTVLVQPLYHQP